MVSMTSVYTRQHYVKKDRETEDRFFCLHNMKHEEQKAEYTRKCAINSELVRKVLIIMHALTYHSVI